MSYIQKALFIKLLGILCIGSILISFSGIQKSRTKRRTNIDHLYYSLKESGEKYLRNGNFEQAIHAFRQALILVREVDQNKEEIKCLMRLGLLYWNIGQLEVSSENYDKALSRAEKFNLKNEKEKCRKALEIYGLYLKGKEYRRKNEYQKSIESFGKAVHITREIKSKAHEVKCLRQLSVTYWRLNNLQQFFTLNKEALTIARELNNRKEEGRCLNNIGLFYWKLDYYSKALYSYEEAMEKAITFKDKRNESACLNNIGIIYKKLGNYDKSLFYLMKSLSIDYKLGDKIYQSEVLNNIGVALRKKAIISTNKNDFYKALDYFNQCLELTKKTGDEKTEIRVLNNIGFVYSDLENYGRAQHYFGLGYKKAKEYLDLESMGMILNNMGIVHFNQKNYKKAVISFQRSIEIGLRLQAGQILWESYFWLGKCYKKESQFSPALTCYHKAIDVIDNIRSRIFLDTNKAAFVRDKLKVYESLINLLYRLYTENPLQEFKEEIFHIVERAKARSFLESLKESRIDIREKLSPELKEKENEISHQISSIITTLSRGNLSERKREELSTRLKQKEGEYIELISIMRVEIPEVAELISPTPCQVEKLQNQLIDDKTALIEYFLGENRSLMFLVIKNKFYLYSLPAREAIENSIKAYLKVISQPPRGKFNGILAAKRIYKELFLLSINNIPDSVENLIIVPDGMLYYLPFETLIASVKSGSLKGKFLISKYKISYSPSSSSLLFLSDKKKERRLPKSLLAFGNPLYNLNTSSKNKENKTYTQVLKEVYSSLGFDFSPLPYSQREIQEILKYFPKKKINVYFKEKAKEDIVKKISLKDYQIIHFACHGLLDENFPFRSALVLTLDKDVDEDGFLQVSEIYNLRMKADLVILSACQTGRGKLEKGEGVLGLPRIFFYAGAKSVVSSLWKVSDKSTAIFMGYFYHYLFHGSNKTEALRLAKLEMIASKFSHPFYWGAFVLNGDYSSKINFK